MFQAVKIKIVLEYCSWAVENQRIHPDLNPTHPASALLRLSALTLPNRVFPFRCNHHDCDPLPLVFIVYFLSSAFLFVLRIVLHAPYTARWILLEDLSCPTRCFGR